MLLVDSFSFWSQLTTEKKSLENGLAFANTDVPFYLSNAFWHPSLENLADILPWYEARQLPPAVIVPANKSDDLRSALLETNFTFELSFAFRKAQKSLDKTITEQVNWTQMGYAGELLATYYEQPELAINIGKGLGEALQKDSNIKAFLSYEHEPVGTMIIYQGETALSAMLLVDRDGALEHRLVTEAEILGLDAYVLEPVVDEATSDPELTLERWSIQST